MRPTFVVHYQTAAETQHVDVGSSLARRSRVALLLSIRTTAAAAGKARGASRMRSSPVPSISATAPSNFHRH